MCNVKSLKELMQFYCRHLATAVKNPRDLETSCRERMEFYEQNVVISAH